MPTDQHLDTVGLLKAKVEGEIARLEPSIADRENYDDTRVRLHVKAEALRWVLREIEALPPVGVGEEKGMGSCDSASPTRYQSDEAPLPSIAAPASEELAERVARAIYEAKTKLPVTRPGFTHWATWDECCQMEGWLEGQKDTARAALLALNLPVEPGQ